MFKRTYKILALVLIMVMLVSTAWAGAPWRLIYGSRYTDEGANHATPPSGFMDLFVNGDTLYTITDGGVVTELGTASTVTLDGAYTNGNTVTADASGNVEIDLSVTGRTFIINNTFAGTQATAIVIDAEVAQAITDGILFSTTAGTIVDAIDASDASITNAINVGGNIIKGAAAAIDFSEFDVAAATGSVTINDGGDAGAFVVEGTSLDINSLDFVAAGEITGAASSAITINPDGGSAAGEDLIVTAHNVQLTATGALTMSPDVAVTTAIDATDTDYTNALSVGANAILGTTGVINYDDFDVDASGNITNVGDITAIGTITQTGNINVTGDISASGTITSLTIAQDAIVASTADTTLTLDGIGTGGVGIGTASGSGAITLGGSATAVTLPSTVDLTLSGGDVSITDTANSDLVTLVNNTVTTADIIDISAQGTRTSGGVIKVIDSATTAPTITLVSDSATTSNVIAVQADALEAGGAMLYLDSDAIPDSSTYFIECAGTGTDYTLSKDGIATHSGVASTNVITVTTGDVQVDDGMIEVNTDEDDTTYVERAQATVTGPVFSVIEQTHTAASGHSAMLIDQDTTTSTVAALEIDTEGALAIKIDELIQTGDGIKFDVAASYTGQGMVADLGTWLGTAGEGFIDITSDSAATNEAGQAIRVELLATGTSATAIEGKALYAECQAAAKAGESLVYLDTLTNTAIHIDNEGVAADGITIDAAASYTGQGIVANLGAWLGTAGEGFIDINSTSAATNEAGQAIRVELLATGTSATAIEGKALYAESQAAIKAGESLVYLDTLTNSALHIDNEGTAADGIKIDVADTFIGQGIVADLGPWTGVAGEGFINIESDSGAVAEAGQAIRINLQGTTADAAVISGKALYAKDAAASTPGSYLIHSESTANGSLFLSGTADISAAPLKGTAPIVLEGATLDAHEVVLGVTEPTSDTTITFPDGPASGVSASIVSVGTTQTSAAASATSDVTGSSIAVPAGHAAAGQVYTWRIAGTKTGANNPMVVHLKLDGTQSMSLSASDAVALDWVAEFKCYVTGTATQKIEGSLLVNGKVAVTDYATAAVDISGAVNVLCQIQSANAGDTVTSEVVTVTFNE